MLDLPHPAYTQEFLQSVPATAELYDDRVPPWMTPPALTLGAGEDQIAEIARMPDNWDGYGALTIKAATRRNAISALRSVLISAPIPDITPNPNGTISFEWETDLGFAGLEIGQTRISFFCKTKSADPILMDASADDVFIATVKIGELVFRSLFPLEQAAEPITSVRLEKYVSPPH
jgi:hypothetical protein